MDGFQEGQKGGAANNGIQSRWGEAVVSQEVTQNSTGLEVVVIRR
jgi:hypothetical protein